MVMVNGCQKKDARSATPEGRSTPLDKPSTVCLHAASSQSMHFVCRERAQGRPLDPDWKRHGRLTVQPDTHCTTMHTHDIHTQRTSRWARARAHFARCPGGNYHDLRINSGTAAASMP